jgi:hypothetical protein
METPKIIRTEEEILDYIDDLYKWNSSGRYSGMNFAEMTDNFYRWITDKDEERPLPPFGEDE